MKLALLELKKNLLDTTFQALLSATFYGENQERIPHFGHFTVTLTEEEIANLPLSQIEALAITKIESLLK